jgi:hypothetical protein
MSDYYSPVRVALDLPSDMLFPVACVVLWRLSPKLAELVSRFGLSAGITAFGAVTFGLAGTSAVLGLIWKHAIGHRCQFSQLSIFEYITKILRLDLPTTMEFDSRALFVPYICISFGAAIVLWIIAGLLITRHDRTST